MRIAVCHQTFAGGDAIGRDILGMCTALSDCGHEPVIFCETDVHRSCRWEVTHDFSDGNIQSVDVVLYHHSQDWRRGTTLLKNARCPVVFKFHNITPHQFFRGYAADYEERCRLGECLTSELIQQFPDSVWLSDSVFNAEILAAAGLPGNQSFIAPPFNNTEQLAVRRNHATTDDERIRFLFCGRFAPNKGHRHLVRFAEEYRRCFGSAFELIIVGAIDPALNGYWSEFAALARQLDLTEQIRVYPHLPDAVMHRFFETAHAYLTFSEHEGFCVPVIESQAIGLPVVGSAATAVGETAGPGQFLGSPPSRQSDYEFYAELAHMAARDADARHQVSTLGLRNVLRRFSQISVEEAFLHPLVPLILRVK